jgi:reactive intermediate/imine deaminase
MIGGTVSVRQRPLRIRLLIGLPLLVAGTASAQTAEYLTNPEMEALGLPFSEAVRVDDVLFLSGQIGNVPGTLQLVEGGIAPETRQTMENIRATLERHGSSLDRVIKCTVFMADMSEWPAMNEIYATYFPGPKPARSAAGANGLALGARVEIECIALAGDT